MSDENNLSDENDFELPDEGTDSVDTQVFVGKRSALGEQIGPYKLLKIIGEGGMGAVFLAEQREPVKRKVALKVVRFGMDSKETVARFEAERQALSLMNHIGIAGVMDGGTTETGLPYFVMEYVHGQPITNFCDQNQLDFRSRLRLVVQVCGAIQHAHQKGITHRDLKPSNILVEVQDGKAIAKIIDFGLAKAALQNLASGPDEYADAKIIGTPEYMSPEQAKVGNTDVDTRSDIYSIGIILYELLTGSTPLNQDDFTGVRLLSLLNRIREDVPEKPSERILNAHPAKKSIEKNRKAGSKKLSSFYKEDLDWIVMKAIRKERSKRYETPSALAEDIKRYLKNEPIESGKATRSYRFKKVILRNKMAAIAVLGTFVVLLFGLIYSVVQLNRIRQGESQAKQSSESSQTALDDLVDSMLDDVIKSEIITANQRKALENALSVYANDLLAAKDTNRDRLSIANTHYRIGKIRLGLAKDDRGISDLQEAIQLFEKELDDPSSNEKIGASLIDAYYALAISHARKLAFTEARKQLEMANRYNEQLKSHLSGESEYNSNLVAIQYRLAEYEIGATNNSYANKLTKKSIAVQQERIANTNDENEKWDLELFMCQLRFQYGESFDRLEDVKEAFEQFDLAISLYRRLGESKQLSERHLSRLGWMLDRCGKYCIDDGEIGNAKRFHTEAVSVRRSIFERDKSRHESLDDLISSYLQLSHLQRRDEESELALETVSDAVDILDRTFGNELEKVRYEMTSSLRHRAELYILHKQYDLALADLERHGELDKTLTLSRGRVGAWNLGRRALVYARKGEHDRASALIERLIKESSERYESEFPRAFAYFCAARALAELSRKDPMSYAPKAIAYLTIAAKHDKSHCHFRDLSFHEDPDFEPLHNIPEYKRLVGQFKKPTE